MNEQQNPLMERLSALPTETLVQLQSRYPWYRPVQLLLAARGEAVSPYADLVDPWRAESVLMQEEVDLQALMHLSTDDLIDRFLREDDLRIVAEDGEPDSEITTEANLSDEEELVSEPLAEIYLAQGLRAEAIAIYRKLSLLNPEKSVYFAELIDRIENNN
ncbi:MAG: hypothetical protein IKZ12_06090 [Alistipes sp.]|nr:hypothetical protein [Alistipes sp.]